MGELNILFQGDMIRALLNQKPGVWPPEPINPSKPMKWQTRRIVKPQPYLNDIGWCWNVYSHKPPAFASWPDAGRFAEKMSDIVTSPYGRPGSRLWVRETWKPGAWRDDGRIAIDYKASPEMTNTPWITIPDGYGGKAFDDLWPEWTDELLAAGSVPDDDGYHHWEPGQSPLRWRPSIHMPRWASRLDVENKRVRVQRIQDTSVSDMRAEGIEYGPRNPGEFAIQHTIREWQTLWDSINGRPKPSKRNPYTNKPEECYVSYPWDEYRGTEQHRGKVHYIVGNPWVFAIDLMRLR